MEEAYPVKAKEQLPTMDELNLEKTQYDTLRECKKSVEEIVAKMLAIKRAEKPKSEQRQLVTQMFLNFVSLRQANRSILTEEDRVKAETERAKAPVDFITLQLHNLMYEKNHYLKAIKACKDFKSKYPDIELVPEEDFFSDAPEEIKGTTISNDIAHNLMLKRLNYELFQRKELCKLREELEEHKRGLLETIANRKKFFLSLPSHLKSLKKASLPVQHQLGVLHTKKLKQQHSAELLPPPLYIIYSQFMAQKEAFGENIDLEIVGSVKDALSFARKQANKDNGPIKQDTSKVEDDVPDEEDDDQRRRKRPKKVPSKEILDQTGIYQAHPLRVILHIYDDEDSVPKPSKLAALKFEYLLNLNVVCVAIEGSDEGPENSILCNLFPDDSGHELPRQSAILSLGDTEVFDEKRTSRPYKWAQHLAGKDFLPEAPPMLTGSENENTMCTRAVVVSGLSLYRQQNRVETVLKRVRSRKKAQKALAEQLDLLSKLKLPPVTCESVPWILHVPLCNLRSWSTVGPSLKQTYPSAMDIEQRHDSSIVNVDTRSLISRDEIEVNREDGELPSLLPTSKDSPEEGSNLEYTQRVALITKSLISPVKTAKSPSFKKHEEESELMLYSESDVDEPVKIEQETGNAAFGCYGSIGKSWVDYGAREYCLILTRKMEKEGDVELEAMIKISAEYPLRPPLFSLRLVSHSENGGFDWYNELRAMEDEVNLHIVRMLPLEQHKYLLSHQVHCLGMLFDLYLNEAMQPPEKRKYTSVVDVGLCKPVTGALLARSFRGRDRRKMLSWKDMECTPGYPY